MCDWGPEEEWLMEGSGGMPGHTEEPPSPVGQAGPLLWAKQAPAHRPPKGPTSVPPGGGVITRKGKPTLCHKGGYVRTDAPSRTGGAGRRGQPQGNEYEVFLSIRMNDAQGLNGALWAG